MLKTRNQNDEIWDNQFYQNKVPIYEIVSGASIVIAAFLLIVPGFFTDTIGFLLLIPLTRKLIIKINFQKEIKSKFK